MQKRGFLKTFTKYFPLPKTLSFDFVGVDLCKNSVKVMKLVDSKFGKIPSVYKEYLLKNECEIINSDSDFSLKECTELIAIFKNIKKDFKVEYVNVSVPELKTYVYITKLPNNVGDNISETLLYSVEEFVPISPDNVLLDYFVISENYQEIEVVVTVVQKNIVSQYTKILEAANLKPLSFEPETHAISRAIIEKGDENQYIILNLDSCLSSIAVLDNEIIQYTQVLPVATKDFSKEFDEEEARILKENINKVIIYWETSVNNKKTEKIQNIYLIGEYAASHELKIYLEKNLPLNVKFANVWQNTFDLDEYIPKIHAIESLKYATATGLALKRIK
jgi:Tfp pilus assembly PilM family ATPase